MPKFQCDICTEEHDLPLALAFAMPDYASKLLPWDKEEHCKMSEDWCIVDDALYWLRGCLDIPVIGTDSVFSWGVWATLSEEHFDRTMELWEHPSRTAEPPYVGTLANSLPSYSETRGIKCSLITRKVGERPLVRIEEPSHKLFEEQQNGMSLDRAIELAKHVLHANSSNPLSYLCHR